MLNPYRRVSFGLAFTAIVSFVGCASAPADRAAPSPSSSPNESIGKAASAVSVNPRPADPGMVFDVPPAMTNQVVETAYYNSRAVPLSFDGTRYFYTWIDPAMHTPMGRFISEDGNSDGTAMLLGNARTAQTEISDIVSASSAAGAIAVWRERIPNFTTTVYVWNGARIEKDGTQSSFSIPDEVATQYPSTGGGWAIEPPVWISSDAEGFCVFYYVVSVEGGFDLLFRRVGATGTLGQKVVLAQNLEYPLGARDGWSNSPIVASNGKNVFVAWNGITEGGIYDGMHYVAFPLSAPSFAQVRNIPTGNVLALSSDSSGFRAVLNNGSGGHSFVVMPFDEQGVAGAPSSPAVLTQNSERAYRTHDPSVFALADARTFGTEWANCVQLISSTGPIGSCEFVKRLPEQFQSSTSFGDLGLAYGTSTLVEVQGTVNEGSRPSGKLTRYAKGALADPVDVSGATSTVREEEPVLATDGNEYVLIWNDTRLSAGGSETYALLARRLNAEGEAYGDLVTLSLSSLPAWRPSLIFDGTEYAVSWMSGQPDSNTGNLMFATLPRVGALVAENKMQIWSGENVGDIFGTGMRPSVGLSSDGVNRTLVWMAPALDSIGVFGARVSLADDTLVDTTPVLLRKGEGYSFQLAPQIAFGGKRSLLVWLDTSYITGGIGAGFIDAGKMELSGAAFSLLDTGSFVSNVSVAGSTEDTYFVVAQQASSESGGTGMRGAYVNREGKVVGYNSAGKWVEDDSSSTIPIATKSTSTERLSIAYAKDGANFVSAWSNVKKSESDIYGAWIDFRSGRVRDLDGVPVAALSNVVESSPSVAIRGAGKGLVAYQEFVASEGAYRLRLRTIESGSLIGEACTVDNDCGTRLCVDGVCCTSACNDGCGVCNVTPGTCTPKAKGVACGNAGLLTCGGTSTACPTICASNDDCVSHRCVDGVCDTPTVRCISDSELSDENGVVTQCGDYKCIANACRTPCREVSDCRDGLVCTFDGACVSPPSLPEPPEGCMKSSVAGERGPSGYLPMVAIAICVGSIARRRASRVKGGAR